MESVRKQTYPAVEQIVIDGGSTDGTVERLERSSVRWVSESDSGQAEAINKGFALARGSILGWLNADDILVPQAVEWISHALGSDPKAGWAMGDVVIADGELHRRERPAIAGGPSAWSTRNLAAQPGSFHPRDALERVDYLDESFHFMMDLDLWLRLVDAGFGWVYVPRVLAIFELHEASKTGAVSHARFLEEEARARARSGRTEQAGFALGRATAWSALADGSGGQGSTSDLLEATLARHPELRGLSDSDIEAGLAVELAILRLRRGEVGALATVGPSLLSNPLARARLRDVVARAGRQLLRRDRVRPQLR